MHGIPWPWLLGATIGLGCLVLILAIPVSIHLQFEFGQRNRSQTRIRVAWWSWDGDPSLTRDDGPGSPFFQPGATPSSQAGFLHFSFLQASSWKPDWKKMRRWIWARIQHGLFSVATNGAFWRSSSAFVLRLPIRIFQCLKWRVTDMELAHSRPEVLGRLAAWNAGLGNAIGAPLPIRWNFENPHFQCNGTLLIEGRVYRWVRLILQVVGDLPWFSLVVAFWQGAVSPGLKGWRKKSFAWLQRILTLVEARARTPA